MARRIFTCYRFLVFCGVLSIIFFTSLIINAQEGVIEMSADEVRSLFGDSAILSETNEDDKDLKTNEAQKDINIQSDGTASELRKVDIKTLKEKAEDGDAEAQYILFEKYRDGDGVKEDINEAFTWCRKAARRGKVDGMIALSLMYYYGIGTEHNEKESEKWIRIAAEKGSDRAQFLLSILFLRTGWAGTEYTDEGYQLLTKLADQGFVDAQYELGIALHNDILSNHINENNPASENLKNRTIKRYSDAADNGSCESKYILAMIYYNGSFYNDFRNSLFQTPEPLCPHMMIEQELGEEELASVSFLKDTNKAEKYLREAAKEGHCDAQFSLAEICYEKGDDKEAVKWYQEAAKNNHPNAMYKLGQCYEHGDGVSRNLDKAKKWYQAAIEAGGTFGNLKAKHALDRLSK